MSIGLSDEMTTYTATGLRRFLKSEYFYLDWIILQRIYKYIKKQRKDKKQRTICRSEFQSFAIQSMSEHNYI